MGTGPDPNRDIVTRQTIPAVLFETDPTRSYLPSSPYWSEELCQDFYSTAGLPEDHLWGFRSQKFSPRTGILWWNVRDASSGKVIYKGEYEIPANGKAILATLPAADGQGIRVITYSAPEVKEARNHYLYGQPPFNLDRYKELLESAEKYNEVL